MSSFLDANTMFDMEYKDEDDDAWYDVGVFVDMEMKTVTIKFKELAPEYHLEFKADGFETETKLEEFVRRFRLISEPLQDDHGSTETMIGSKVCASYEDHNNDLRFYDAVVKAVRHKKHQFENGEEECLCTFVVEWLHGPDRGKSKSLRIESISNILANDQVHPKIALFSNLAKEKLIQKDEGSEVDYYFILIGNMEIGLLPSSIEQFIQQHISISSTAYVFPCNLPEETFANGAIMVNCQKKHQEIYKFLNKPDQYVIVSKRGRPWVIGEHGSRKQPFRSFTQDNCQSNNGDQRLSVVLSGSKAYERAKQLRDRFVAFEDQRRKLYARHAFEENEVIQAYQST